MERDRTTLVEEGNTIYEIDLNCMRRKKIEREREDPPRIPPGKNGRRESQ